MMIDLGVGFRQRLKLVVLPLNALMRNDNLDSASTQEKSGFKGILYFYEIFYFYTFSHLKRPFYRAKK